jgi:hypothetical protein
MSKNQIQLNLEESVYATSICKLCGKPLSDHSSEFIRFIITDYNNKQNYKA